jgi:hypothetical protein
MDGSLTGLVIRCVKTAFYKTLLKKDRGKDGSGGKTRKKT